MGLGFIASLARPGGNVTGLAALGPELNTKRLEILKDAVPKLARVGLLWRPVVNLGQDLQLKELRLSALALKLKLEEIETQLDAKGLENAFQTAKQKQVNAIMTTATRSFFSERKRIVELAGKYRLPAIYPNKEFVDEGGLMSYGEDPTDQYRRAAGYVDKILKGANPADLPVQQATKFEFMVNLKAAKQIGLTIPVRVLERGEQSHKVTGIRSQMSKIRNTRRTAIIKTNLNLFGLCSLLLALCSSGDAQQPKKIPRIGYLSTSLLPLTPRGSRHYGRGCASSATWRGRTLSLSGDMRREK